MQYHIHKFAHTAKDSHYDPSWLPIPEKEKGKLDEIFVENRRKLIDLKSNVEEAGTWSEGLGLAQK